VGGRDVRALGENLKRVMRAFIHHPKDLLDELKRQIFMEKITHGVHENCPRRSPLEWKQQRLGMGRKLEAVRVLRLAHSS
jgi:hypothetical protein